MVKRTRGQDDVTTEKFVRNKRRKNQIVKTQSIQTF